MRLTAFILIVYAVAWAARGQSPPPELHPQQTLDSLRAELHRIDAELESGKTHEKGLLRDKDVTERKVALLEQMIRNQQGQSRSLKDSAGALTAEISWREGQLVQLGDRLLGLEDEHNQMSVMLAKSLLAERRMSDWAALEFLLGSGSWREFLARRALLKRLEVTGRLALAGMSATADTLHDTEDDVFTRTQLLRDRKAALDASRTEAAQVERNLQSDAARVAGEKRSLQSQLVKLHKDQKLLTERRQEIASAQAQIEKMISEIAIGVPMTGAPLSALKGMLPWPVIGRIVQKFGLFRNRELSTLTDNPGIDLGTAADAEVTSVAEGKVSSVTWLRGFGNVCIVEHPESYYTVYAKLGQVVVKPKDAVKAGTIIGYPGFDAATEEYRVHFELWSGKEKKNPSEWLRPQ
jgi:murein hydrolase activator